MITIIMVMGFKIKRVKVIPHVTNFSLQLYRKFKQKK